MLYVIKILSAGWPLGLTKLIIQVPNAPSSSQCKSLVKPATIEKTCGQQGRLLSPDESVTRVRRSQHNIESFHLPHLPSPSTLQLPSFLNFSTTHSLTLASLANQCPSKSSHSLPASILFSRSSSHVSVRPTIIQKTKNAKVYEGPQWIPAFHHPNSPYVPWSSPKRRRILRPLTPESPITPPIYSRHGAVAPEPWSSHSSTEIPANVEKRSGPWKGFMKSIRGSLRSMKSSISRIGNTRRFSRRRADVSTTNCGNDLSVGDCVVSAEDPLPTSPSSQTWGTSGSHVSLDSVVSSDSTTLAAWLAERCTISDIPCQHPGMSLEEYEMMGSWLDLHRGDGDWVCGVPDCDVHTPNGSLGALYHGLRVFRTAMPFDATTPMPETTSSSTLPPSCSLWPPPQTAMTPKIVETCDRGVERLLMSKKSRELGMPGGWMFSPS